MAERIPEIGDVKLPMRDGEMRSITELSRAGVDWGTILQITYVAALQSANLHPEIGEIPDPEELRRERVGTDDVHLSYHMVRLSESPDLRRARRDQEKQDWETERRLRGDAIWYDWIP